MIKDFIIYVLGRHRPVSEARDESRPLSDATLMPFAREKRSGPGSPIPSRRQLQGKLLATP